MELGSGVFLSAVFLGTVALFIATKDRWNWKKILFWPVAVILCLSVVGGVAAYLYEQYQSRPLPQTELWGIKLRASTAEVKFLKGDPTHLFDGDIWVYSMANNEGNYVVRFKDGIVRFVVYDGGKLYAPTIAGLSAYSSLNKLEEKLGAASFVSRSKDELSRWYSFEKFNVIALFKKGEIDSFGIYDAQTGPMRFKDEAP